MAIEELSKKIKDEELEKRKRYPILDIVNNREEIRDISEKTIEYAGELYPELKGLTKYVIVPRIVIEVMLNYYKLIDSKKAKGKNVYINIGDFMTIGIEYGETATGDKVGTFNPIIKTGPELQYYNDDPSKNELSKTLPVFNKEDEGNLEFVCKNTQNVLKANYGIIVDEWTSISKIFTSFLRITRDYLISHKDDAGNDAGLDIYLGTVLDIGIAAEDTDNGVEYIIQYAPGQTFKFDNAKSDEDSEKESNDTNSSKTSDNKEE